MIRLTDLLRAEFTKLRTLPAVWAALGLAVPATVLLGLLAATDAVRVAGPDGTVPIARLGGLLLAPAYLLLAVPVLAAGAEHRGGQVRVSLAAMPRRSRWFAAKLLVSAAVTAAAGLVVALAGTLAQHRGGVEPGELVRRTVAGLLLGLVGFGFAAAVRSVVTPLAVLVVLPVAVSPIAGTVLPQLVRLLPHEAMVRFAGPGGSPGRLAGLLVLTGWAAVSLAAGWCSTVRRDA